MVFERSTPILRTTTRPSVGEDYSYYRNTNLKEITIDGYKVYDNVINAGDEEITVTLPYDFDVTSPVDRLRVEAIPECVDIPPSKTQQARSGAVTDVNFPEQLPGKGNIVVTAGSGEIRVYNINFEKSDIPITLESAINLPSALTPGYRLVTFNIKNYDSEARDATVIFVLEDKETGELQQILHDRRQIEPGTIRLISLRLNIPAQVDKYIAHVYFYDNVLNMNQIINTITLTAN